METALAVLIAIVVTFTFATFTLFVHEFGHVVVAWFLGAKIIECKIGFVELFSFKAGGIKFSFGALPFWGHSEIDLNSVSDKSYILIVAAGGVLNLLAGFFIASFLPGGLASIPVYTVGLLAGNSALNEAIILLSLFNLSAAVLNLIPFPRSDGFNIIATLLSDNRL